MSEFKIETDIRRAETLSSAFYTCKKYFEESKEKIFVRSWQMLGSTDEIKNLKPYTILENFLDEPILITRQNETINCLSNVCTHRGKILIENECAANGIRCGYHGRRFDLGGKFLSMPEFETAENFPTEKDNLPHIPFEIWNKFLFVSINPIVPLGEYLGEARKILQAINFENLKFSSATDYEVKAHWALYCENYLEGFHIPFVHKTLNETIEYDSYKTEIFRFSSLQTALTKNDEDAFDFDKSIAAFYFFVFPNLMLNFYPWGLSVNIVKPQTKDLTKISYLTFVNDESRLNTGAGADLEAVEFEDQAVVESVQKGINSRLYDRGRYSPEREKGTHHFHRLIAEFMN
ncbi:MAG: aromatic ring-hydroxylating dioxygenase subunit alpha [Pyrinomonadaceae bacterium]